MTQNKPNKVEEIKDWIETDLDAHAHGSWIRAPKFHILEDVAELLAPRFAERLTSSYEQGREDERDRIAQIIESRQCNEYTVRTFVGKLGKVEARTYDEKTLANAVIGDILHSLKNN